MNTRKTSLSAFASVMMAGFLLTGCSPSVPSPGKEEDDGRRHRMPPLLIVGALDPDSSALPGVTVSYQGEEDHDKRRMFVTNGSGMAYLGASDKSNATVTVKLQGFEAVQIEAIELKENAVYFLGVTLNLPKDDTEESQMRTLAWRDIRIHWQQMGPKQDDLKPAERKGSATSYRMRWPLETAVPWHKAGILNVVSYGPDESFSEATLEWNGEKHSGTVIRPRGWSDVHIFVVPDLENATLEFRHPGWESVAQFTGVSVKKEHLYLLELETDLFDDAGEDPSTETAKWTDVLTGDDEGDSSLYYRKIGTDEWIDDEDQ